MKRNEWESMSGHLYLIQHVQALRHGVKHAEPVIHVCFEEGIVRAALHSTHHQLAFLEAVVEIGDAAHLVVLALVSNQFQSLLGPNLFQIL